MRFSKLPRIFYTRDTLIVANDLLGKYLVRQAGKSRLAGKIVETEAYIGPRDRASHAFNGKRTKRNEAEFLAGGHVYIYLVYGMYWQFNITTGAEGKPECVLIRALKMNDGENEKAASGPGKLCRYLRLDKSFYGEDLVKSQRLWLEDRGEVVRPREIKATGRVGIDYAGPYWAKRKWRFVIRC